jgi:hypothetical protein
MNYLTLRDDIFKALNEVYAPEFADKSWFMVKYRGNFSTDMNMQLTTDILALFVFNTLRPAEAREFQAEVRNMIWNCFPGGGAAELAASRVLAVINSY